MESETERDPEARLQDFREEDERCVYRSGSEETVDTVVAVSTAKKQQHTKDVSTGVGARRRWTQWWRLARP